MSAAIDNVRYKKIVEDKFPKAFYVICLVAKCFFFSSTQPSHDMRKGVKQRDSKMSDKNINQLKYASTNNNRVSEKEPFDVEVLSSLYAPVEFHLFGI